MAKMSGKMNSAASAFNFAAACSCCAFMSDSRFNNIINLIVGAIIVVSIFAISLISVLSLISIVLISLVLIPPNRILPNR